MSITQFTIEEVRCFGERQTLEIRPLTFLVGENSTGKTTTLACFQVLANYLQGKSVNFNQLSSLIERFPYSMGTFKDIVRNSRKKEKVFRLGFTSKYANQEIEWTVDFIEKKEGIEPVVRSITMELTDGKIIIESDDKMNRKVYLEDFKEKQNHYRIVCDTDILNSFPIFFILTAFREESEKEKVFSQYLQNKSKESKKSRYELWNIWDSISVSSTSPIRSRPERTYDPTRESNDPEGSDVPMYLMRIEATQKERWALLKEQLIEFGKRSGLFQNIEIKRLGRALGSPFQLQFKVRGPKVNFIDVGYGVSQILPILVQVLNPNINRRSQRTKLSNFTLLQQPEVHLHPRAQAEFSSLVVELARQGNQSFIIETHSDNMIDRARIEIRKGNIKPEDVSLIYFEPIRNIVKVHNIGFDKMGNLLNVPKHYRDFFLLESDRLMGFED